MKTTCLLLVTFFAAVVLAAYAAPTAPSLIVVCTTGDCTGDITLEFANLDPTVTYHLMGVNTTTGDSCCGSLIGPAPNLINSDGSFNFDAGALSAGIWEFTLFAEHKNGRLARSPEIDQFYHHLVP